MTIIVPFSFHPSVAWEKVYDYFRYVLVFYLVYKVLTDFSQYRIFVHLFIIYCFYIGVLARHNFTGTRLDGVGLADAADSNMLAALMLLVIPYLIILLLSGNKWERIISCIAAPFVVNTFMMCRSRGAFVGIIVEFIVLFIFLLKPSF